MAACCKEQLLKVQCGNLWLKRRTKVGNCELKLNEQDTSDLLSLDNNKWKKAQEVPNPPYIRQKSVTCQSFYLNNRFNQTCCTDRTLLYVSFSLDIRKMNSTFIPLATPALKPTVIFQSTNFREHKVFSLSYLPSYMRFRLCQKSIRFAHFSHMKLGSFVIHA